MTATREGPLTALAMAVLDVLHERAMHPYEMTQLIRRRGTDLGANLGTGSLYRTVERLEAGGLLGISGTDRQGRRPKRTVYHLTERGRDAFVARTRQMISIPVPERTTYAHGLSAAGQLGRDDFLEQLRSRVTTLRAQLVADDKQSVTDRLDLAFARNQRKSELAWTLSLIGTLETDSSPRPNDDPIGIHDQDRCHDLS